MADVELFDLGNRRHRLDILVGEAVAGVDGELDLLRMRRGASQLL